MITLQTNRKYSFTKCFSLVLIYSFLLVPFTVLADPIVLVRTADVPDMVNTSVVKKVKLSATLKMEKNGAMVIQCLNLFSIPVARAPFNDNPGIRKLTQRTRLQVEPNGRGVIVKMAFQF
jgi:hypothetical protein